MRKLNWRAYPRCYQRPLCETRFRLPLIRSALSFISDADVWFCRKRLDWT